MTGSAAGDGDAPLICAVDETPRGVEAAAVAMDLSRRLGARLVLTRIVHEPSGVPFGDGRVLQRARGAGYAAALEDVRELAMMLDLPSETELHVDIGRPAPLLGTLAAERSASLVVVGSRGRGRLRSALFGSVTRELAEGLSCPLVVVPPGAAAEYSFAAAEPDATVLCGIDDLPTSPVTLAVADHLAARLDARLHVVFVDSPAALGGRRGLTRPLLEPAGVVHQHDRIAQALFERAESSHRTVELSFELGDPAQTISDVAGRGAVQLVVVDHQSSWQRLASRSGVPVAVVGPR